MSENYCYRKMYRMKINHQRVAMRKFLLTELTVNEPNNRGRSILSIILSIVVLLLISSLIVAAIVIINPEIANFNNNHRKARAAITLEEALLGELSARDFSSHWLPANSDKDADQLLYEDAKSLYLVTLPSESHLLQVNSSQQHIDTTHHMHTIQQNHFQPNVTVLVSNTSLLSSIEYQGYKLSPSKRFLLIWTAKKKHFRHSFTAKYFIYDIKLDLISLISTKPTTGGFASSNQSKTHNLYENLDTASLYLYDPPTHTVDDDYVRFQLVDWFSLKDDNNVMHDSLILIQNNDIYALTKVAELSNSLVKNFAQETTSAPSKPIRLTHTGRAGDIFNGVPDWLYEEEILTHSPAFRVSPTAEYLAYLSFNDTLVNYMPFSVYGEQIIPRIQRIKYPKTGQPNPSVSLHIINLRSISSQNEDSPSDIRDVRVNLPQDLASQQHYINRIYWLTGNKLAVTWSNRNQNESQILICSDKGNDWECVKNLHLRAAGGWLDVGDDLFAIDENYYLALIPKFEGADVGSYKHIAKVSLNKPNDLIYLTSGRKEVLTINGIDAKSSLVYYTSTVEDEPGQRQLYVSSILNISDSVSSHHSNVISQGFSQKDPPGPSSCITCEHYPNSCLYNFVKMSPSTKHYIFQCDGPDIPRTELRTTENIQTDFNERFTFQKPKNLKNPATSILVNATMKKYSIVDKIDRDFKDESLLWTIEDNSDLRAKVEHGKAMPLTVRLRIPIPNTNYSANVLLLLPPQMGPQTTFRSKFQSDQIPQTAQLPVSRSRRDITGEYPAVQGLSSSQVSTQPEQAQKRIDQFEHLDAEAIKEYASQLPSGQQYPMVVDVYGGPGSQKVDYQYNVYFGHYLASSRRIVYAMIDGRGSGYQGSKRLFELYHKLGTVEIQDQIDVAAHLTKILTFVDPTKVAIWGWSYGGYAAAMALAQSNARVRNTLQSQILSLKSNPELFATTPTSSDISMNTNKDLVTPKPKLDGSSAQVIRSVFQCAASVAPVTNWLYYDTAYTEKYMSSPWVNEKYDEYVFRDHLVGNRDDNNSAQHMSKIKLQQSVLSNKWTQLNQSAVDMINSNVRPSASKLFELIAKSGQFPTSNNSTAKFYFKTNQASPMFYELNDRYRRASLLDQIGDIDRKKFLLIHGTADDNVHFQQSIMLMKQLIRKNILFQTRLYPDQDHSIANRADKLHLGSTLSNFFAECFDLNY